MDKNRLLIFTCICLQVQDSYHIDEGHDSNYNDELSPPLLHYTCIAYSICCAKTVVGGEIPCIFIMHV